MIKKIYIVFVFFSLNNSFGQINKDLERANAYYEIGEYANAIRYFEFALARKKNKEIVSKIAHAYLKINQLKKSEKYFHKLETKNNLTELDYISYINVLFREHKKDKLTAILNRFQQQYPENKQYQKIKSVNDSLEKWQKNESKYKTENLSKINTEFSEISPFRFNNELYLASNKEDIFIKKKSGSDLLPYYNLYICDLDSNDLPKTKLKDFSSFISTKEHECAISFSKDGQHIFLAQNVDHLTNKGQTINQSKLFTVQKQNDKWLMPQSFVFNDSSYSYTHPSLDSSYKMLFFASDMKGGFGGTDIYVCINLNGKWTNPINLGNKINTSGNEIYPFYHSSGKLYFSTDSQIGYGGYDIFMAEEIDGEWDNVTNLKTPFNSISNDFGFWMDDSGNSGFFSSNRKGGKGAEDIYRFFLK